MVRVAGHPGASRLFSRLIRERLGLILVWLALFLFQPGSGQAEGVAILSPGQDGPSLGAVTDYLIDRDGTLGPDQLARPDAPFQPLGHFRSAGYTPWTYWYRLRVLRPADSPGPWIMTLGRPYVDDIRVYMNTENGWQETRLGDHIPFRDRVLPTIQHAMPLSLTEGRDTTILIRVRTTSALAFAIHITPDRTFAVGENHLAAIGGLFCGILILAAIFHMAFALWLRDATSGLYAAFVLCLMVGVLSAYGLAAPIFQPTSPFTMDWLTDLSILCTHTIVALLWRRILNLKTHMPRLDRFYLLIGGGMAIATATVTLESYRYILTVFSIITFPLCVLSFVLIIKFLQQNTHQPILWYYFLGFASALIGGVVNFLGLRGAIPLDGWTDYAYPAMSVVHLILLNGGLAQRIRDIRNAQFQARQDADLARHRADEQRRFVAMLSHEFRSPLAGISSAAQMVRFREPGLCPASLDRMDRIEHNAHHLARLIDIFLTSETLDHGTLALAQKPFRIGELFDQIQSHMETGERVSFSAPHDLHMTADLELMAVALGNMIANALRYAPADTPIHATASSNAHGITITIRDHGPGLTADDLERVGTLYVRGSASAGTSGTGLGLYITQKILHAHGGHLHLGNADGGGAIASLSLPASSCV